MCCLENIVFYVVSGHNYLVYFVDLKLGAWVSMIIFETPNTHKDRSCLSHLFRKQLRLGIINIYFIDI